MHEQTNPNRHPEPLLTGAEACEFLRIRPRQLYTWRSEGLIPFIRIGRSVRYRRKELEAALDALTVGGWAVKGASESSRQDQAGTDQIGS